MAPLSGGYFFAMLATRSWERHPPNQIGFSGRVPADYAACRVAPPHLPRSPRGRDRAWGYQSNYEQIELRKGAGRD